MTQQLLIANGTTRGITGGDVVDLPRPRVPKIDPAAPMVEAWQVRMSDEDELEDDEEGFGDGDDFDDDADFADDDEDFLDDDTDEDLGDEDGGDDEEDEDDDL